MINLYIATRNTHRSRELRADTVTDKLDTDDDDDTKTMWNAERLFPEESLLRYLHRAQVA